MSCCCPHSRSTSKFFSFFAKSYCRRFKKRGFEPSQKQLLLGLELAGFQEASVLEIGCGVGHLHQTLLEQGAGKATGIDLSPEMIKLARGWASERGLAKQVKYYEGDFTALADQLEMAEIILLDKVICCYPDMEGLMEASIAKTQRVYGFTIPRDEWYVRLGVAVMSIFMWLGRSNFRSFVHNPDQIQGMIESAGFEKQFEMKTLIWLTQVYVRKS